MAKIPRLTVRCEYPDDDLAPTVVSFCLSPSYGIHTARDAHDWFLEMMRKHDEFEVETDVPGEWPVPVCSETVRRVLVEYRRAPYVLCASWLRNSTYQIGTSLTASSPYTHVVNGGSFQWKTAHALQPLVS